MVKAIILEYEKKGVIMWGTCTECNQEVEITRHADYDGPDICPECCAVDSIIFDDE